MTIRDNARKGKRAEDLHKYKDGLEGWKIERTGIGSDYYQTRKDLAGNKEEKWVDVKNGGKLSNLQKNFKKAVEDDGDTYQERHYDGA